MHVFEHSLPFRLGSDLALNLRPALLHNLDHALVLARIQPEAMIVLGAGIEVKVVEAVLEFVERMPAMRAGIIRFGLEMDQRAFVTVLIESDVLQHVEFVEIQPHPAAVRAGFHFDHPLIEFFNKFGFAFGAIHVNLLTADQHGWTRIFG